MATQLESFIRRMRPLILLEKNAEVDKAKEEMQQATEESRCSNGNTLFNLKCSEVEGGLFGRHLLTLIRNPRGSGSEGIELPGHKFTPHDIVEIRPSKGGLGPLWASGLIYRVMESSIIVAVEDLPEDNELNQLLRMDKLANEVTYNRLCSTLEALAQSDIVSRLHPSRLLDVAFDDRTPTFSSQTDNSYFNKSLDLSQREAVDLALQAHDVAMVHGPPGTGKTTTVIEIICQEVERGNSVLACAASNIAVDNIVSRLSCLRYFTRSVVRLGHPARLLPEAFVEIGVLESCRTESNQKAFLFCLASLMNDKNRELRRLSKEQRQRQERAVMDVLKNAAVVCSTLSGVQGRHIDNMDFDVVVIDEAAQALEVACWGALLKCKKAILAGDHLQLPPTVISEEAAKRGLRRTLFERLHKQFRNTASVMLNEQYRMNAQIMQWASDELYESRLIAHPSVSDHTLHDLEGVNHSVDLPVFMFVDTAGCGCEEIVGEDGLSRANPEEAKGVMKHVDVLLLAGIQPKDIGIITPYNGQVALLRELRTETHARIEIASVDGFQGREKEAIVISTVRSNDHEEVGFLNDHRRMNVAITRARRHCTVFGDSGTLSVDPFLERLVAYIEANGEYRCYEEFMQ